MNANGTVFLQAFKVTVLIHELFVDIFDNAWLTKQVPAFLHIK
jgi:hypothetical protein